MNKNETEKYIKDMLDKNLFAVIYPKDKSEASAQKLIDVIDSAVGIAKFKDDDNNNIWGVLVDKTKVKESIKLTEEGKDGISNMQNGSVSI